jgi:hypothetical protein
MVVSIKLSKGNMALFKDALDRVKTVNDESSYIIITPQELRVGNMARGKESGFGAAFISSFFDEYTVDEEVRLIVNSKILNRAVGRMKKGNLQFHEGKFKLVTKNSSLVLPVYAPEEEFDPNNIINMSGEVVLSIPNEFITESIKDMGVDDVSTETTINIRLVDYVLYISRKTSYIDVTKDFVTENDGDFLTNVDYDHFKTLVMKTANKAETVRLEGESGRPVVVKYLYPEGVKMAFALAPQLISDEDEEEFPHDDFEEEE